MHAFWSVPGCPRPRPSFRPRRGRPHLRKPLPGAHFRHLRAGEYDEATEIYWQLQPARKAKQAVAAQLHGGAFINRQAWKFQAWLQGYNGGPLRQPGGHLCIVPVHGEHRGRLFLPFADDDPKTAEVMSKVLPLAKDKEIKDPTILEQILPRG